jgi:hypothetical protein
MQTFTCDECAQLLFFENNHCIRCGHLLGFSIEEGDVLTLKPNKQLADTYVDVSDANGASYRLCGNSIKYNACNWLIPADQAHEFCASCRLTEVMPPLQDETQRKQWVRVEAAKRRLLYTLHGLQLAVQSRTENPKLGLAFRFEESTKEKPVYTGHASGIITMNMAEANASFRENAREKLGEVYRTVLGHLRHECGHYYWELLVLPSHKWLPKARALFGDEQASYKDAIDRHYEKGAPKNWSDMYISAYATMHPWEDWAETWAHYLHMLDTLETAGSYDLAVKSNVEKGQHARIKHIMRNREDFDALFDMWYSLTFVLNGLSRSMGMPDTYPFVISTSVKEKLRLVHDIIRDMAQVNPMKPLSPEPLFTPTQTQSQGQSF